MFLRFCSKERAAWASSRSVFSGDRTGAIACETRFEKLKMPDVHEVRHGQKVFLDEGGCVSSYIRGKTDTSMCSLVP